MKVKIYTTFDKNPMLAYEAKSEHEAIAYSAGVRKANTAYDLGLFHQIGSDGMEGFHGWEIWKGLDELNERNLELIAEFATNQAYAFMMKWYPSEVK